MNNTEIIEKLLNRIDILEGKVEALMQRLSPGDKALVDAAAIVEKAKARSQHDHKTYE